MTRYHELVIISEKKIGSYVHGSARNAIEYSGNMKDRKVIRTKSQDGFSKGNPACPT